MSFPLPTNAERGILLASLTSKEQIGLFFFMSTTTGVQADIAQKVLNHQHDASDVALKNLELDIDGVLTTDLGITDATKRTSIIALLRVMWANNIMIRPTLISDPATVSGALGFAYGPPPCPVGQNQLDAWNALTQ